jgi:magnesium transporter
VLSAETVITFQERAGDVFDPVRRRLREGTGPMRRSGVDYLAYALLDTVVDH